MIKRGKSPGARAGFTLVEILIVVTIIAILAAIVIPHYTKASDSAKASALLVELQTIRKQLIRYQLDHNDQFPTVAQMWGNLTGRTNADGGPGTEHGPYLEGDPVNPFTGGSAVAADNSADWEYDDVSGMLRAVVPAAIMTEMNLSTSDTVASGS